MAKRVLVTGGAGFIPSNFIHHLLAKTPYEVVSLDALTYAGNLDNLSGAMSHERLSFVHGDIRDVELVRDVVSEVDVIVNAAAESHVEKSIDEGAREFVTTNVEGTQILLDAVREAPVEAVISAPLEQVAGEVLNVATGIDIPVTQIADAVLEALGKPSSLKSFVTERPGQVDRHIGSTEKMERLTGWRARTSFEEGLARTIAWYRENEAWWRGILENETRASVSSS